MNVSRVVLSIVSFAAAVAVAALAVTWLLGDDDPAATPSTLSVESAQAVEVRSAQGGADDPLSTPLSPVYVLSGSPDLEEPVTLRFDLSGADVADPGLLRVAYREAANEEWSWVRGRLEGDSYVVETTHLSEWQLRELSCEDRVSGAIDFRIGTQNSDPGDPLIYACAREIDGKPGLVVFNNRSIGLEFPVLDEARVVKTGSRTLAEQAWGPLNSLQYGEPWLLVPGDGFVALSFDRLPEELIFEATNSAFVFDLLLSAGGGAGSAFVGCAHSFAESTRTSEFSFAGVRKVLSEGVKACGGRLGRLLDLGRLYGRVRDSIGSIFESATVSFDEIEPARLPEPRSALRLEGPVDFTGIAPVEVGMTKAEAETATGLHFLLTPILDGCGALKPSPGMGGASEDDYLPGASLMVIAPDEARLWTQGRIARVYVFERGYETAAGVGVGSTEAEVIEAYEPFVRVTQHHYDPQSHYLIVRSPAPALRRYRIVFETDGQRVDAFRAGRLPEVEFVEGCV